MSWFLPVSWVFFFKQKTAYEIGVRLVGSEMCIRDRYIAKRGVATDLKIVALTVVEMITGGGAC